MSEHKPLISKDENAYYPVLQNDEISLVDLWLALTRHKALMAIILITVIAVGTLYAVTRPATYEYKTAIEIGKVKTTIEEGVSKIELIQRPQTVQAKLTESYIPLVLNKHARTNPNDTRSYRIEATVPKGSELVVLSGKGPKDAAAIYTRLLNSVVMRQVADHKRLIAAERRLLESKLARLADLEQLVSAEIDQLDTQIKRTQATRAEARSEVKTAPGAMTMLLIDNGVQENLSRLSELRERLEVTLKNERVDLEGRLSTLQETRMVAEPFQSKAPVGTSKSLMVALSLVLGTMLAVFSAFFAEFLRKVREAVNEKAEA